jgi:hypothetical protein
MFRFCGWATQHMSSSRTLKTETLCLCRKLCRVSVAHHRFVPGKTCGMRHMIRHIAGFCPRASLRVHPVFRHSSRALALGHIHVFDALREVITCLSSRQHPYIAALPFARGANTKTSPFRSATRQRPVTSSRHCGKSVNRHVSPVVKFDTRVTAR